MHESFFIRHGRSILNETGVHQRRETPLSLQGRKQAEAIAERLVGIDAALVLSSNLVRAAETAMAIGGRINKRVIYTDLLSEWKKPSGIAGMRYGERKDEEIWNKRIENINNKKWHYSDEENVFDLKKRVIKLCIYLDAIHNKNKPILIVTHGSIIEMMVALAAIGSGLTGRRYIDFRHIFSADKNTGITEIEIKNGLPIKVLTFNGIAHMKKRWIE